ncbi:MAG: mechanosensitive ion channel [Flavobacteriales bacterium]|nr:mechanosensitive ion channel [Flavobacteriales bacterium]MCB9178787.1 mechanosensitive ion channel [Flavobacteriales bacterium]HPF90717.1 mechanosensitive ion channel [Flavobacteriales bacterium]
MNELIQPVDQLTTWSQKGMALIMEYGPKVLMALIVLWIGSLLIRMLASVLNKVLDRRGVEPTLKRFLHSLVTISLRILLFLTVIQMMGVATTSFVAIVGAAGLAVGLALQGTLANFAGGTLILLFKPYKVGDLIEAQGVLGTVKEIQIFTTLLLTPENKTAIIPNGAMANGNIVNYSADGRMRVDLTMGVGYGQPLDKVRQVLEQVMRDDALVLSEPAPSVTVNKLNLEGIELAVRPWCDPKDYWTVYFGILEKGITAVQAAGIQGPRPSMTITNLNN